MKKLICLILMFTLCLSLCACKADLKSGSSSEAKEEMQLPSNTNDDLTFYHPFDRPHTSVIKPVNPDLIPKMNMPDMPEVPDNILKKFVLPIDPSVTLEPEQ